MTSGPRTLYENIWDAHVVERREDGTCLIYIDRHLVHEVTSPQAFEGLRAAGRKVRRPDLTLAVPDHNLATTRRVGSDGARLPINDPASREQLSALGVRIRWAGRMPKLWKSVVTELQIAEAKTSDNDLLTLYMCVNYGGRAEIADAAAAIARDVRNGLVDPARVNEKTLAGYLYHPDMPDVDLFIRPSGEQRTSNFLIWQSAYAEMVFQDVLWPDFDRRNLWAACEEYARRDRRYGGALPNDSSIRST